MRHEIQLKLKPSDADWLDRYIALSASAKALMQAILEACGDSLGAATSHELAQALHRRWTLPYDTIGLAMAELIDADCIAIIRRSPRSGLRRAA